MIEWLMDQPWWLLVVMAVGVLDVVCALIVVYLCVTSPREEEVYGRNGVDI